MKDFILSVCMDENMEVTFENGINRLNVHQSARQFIQVKLSDFTLSEDETLHIAFEKSDGSNTSVHLNPVIMNLAKEEDVENGFEIGAYYLRLPVEVRNTTGEWKFTLYVKSNWNEETGTADSVWSSKEYTFSEFSAIEDDGISVPSETDIAALYNTAVMASKNAEANAESANASAAQASFFLTKAEESAESAAQSAAEAETIARETAEATAKETAEGILDGKVDKSSIVQTMGQATDKTMSQKTITDIINDLGARKTFNLVNPDDTDNYKEGEYWEGFANTETADTYLAVNIPVKKGKAYSISGHVDKNYSWFWSPGIEHYALTETDAVIYGSSQTFVAVKKFVPENDGFLHITSRTYYQNRLVVIEGNEVPIYYTPYGVVRDRYLYDEIVGNVYQKIIRVEKDGSGDYTKLIDAIAYAIQFKNSIVYVGEGTYDLIEELGEDYFNSITESSSENSGIILTNGIHLIFQSNSFVVCNYTGNNDYVKYKFSPFVVDKLKHKGFTIESMHITAKNVRYCVHDDVGGQVGAYCNKYLNCHMFIDNTNNNVWTAETCIGGGCGCATYIIIKNCYFNSAVTSGWNPSVVSYHNANNNHSPCRSNIIIDGCYFAGVSKCQCSHYGTHDETSRMTVSNCSLAVAPVLKFEDSANFPDENFELISFNNEIRSA